MVVGDGSRGAARAGPFDAIAVHATAPAPPPALLDQLAEGGRLVVPIAAGDADMLTVFRRRGDELRGRATIGPCRFVPLIGEEGFARVSAPLARSAAGRVGSTAVLDDVVVAAAAAVDRLSRWPSSGVDEVAAALADEGVGAEVAEEAVVAVVADQDVGAVGSLEALVVAADLVGVAAAGRAAAAAEGDPSGRRSSGRRRRCRRRGRRRRCGPGRSATEVTSRSLPGPPSRLSAPGSA